MNLFLCGNLANRKSDYRKVAPFVQATKPATIQGYALYRGRFTYYLQAEPGESVTGELATVEDEAVAVLDADQGVPFMARRAELVTTDGEPVTVYLALYPEKRRGVKCLP